MEFLFLIIGLLLGAVLAFLFFKSKNNVGIDTSTLDLKIIELDKEKAVLETKLENAFKDYERLDYDFKTFREQLTHDFNKEKVTNYAVS
jgi:hypothetical protein